MKKYLSVLLLISLLLVSMVSCNNVETPQNNPSDTTATNSDSTPVFTDSIKDYDMVDDSSTEGFIIKAKKYKYEDNNVLLLNVKNTTKTNYSVSVSVDFCDSTGNTVKTESQTFEGYAAGYEKLFLFEPQITFDSYTYKVTVEEYTGECYAQHVDVWFDKLYEEFMYIDPSDVTKHPTAYARCNVNNLSGTDLIMKGKFVLIDNTGKIFKITSLNGKISITTQYKDVEVSYSRENDTALTEELKGKVSGICIIDSITTFAK